MAGVYQDVGLLVLPALGKVALATHQGGRVAWISQPADRPEAVAQLTTRCPQHLAKQKWGMTVAPASEKASSDLPIADD